jgi:hypothetical protein
LISGKSELAEVVVASVVVVVVVVVGGGVSVVVDSLAVVVVPMDDVVGDPESPHANRSRVNTKAKGKSRRMIRRG